MRGHLDDCRVSYSDTGIEVGVAAGLAPANSPLSGSRDTFGLATRLAEVRWIRYGAPSPTQVPRVRSAFAQPGSYPSHAAGRRVISIPVYALRFWSHKGGFPAGKGLVERAGFQTSIAGATRSPMELDDLSKDCASRTYESPSYIREDQYDLVELGASKPLPKRCNE